MSEKREPVHYVETQTEGGRCVFIECDGPEDTTVRAGHPEVLKRAWPEGVPFPPPPGMGGTICIDCDGPEDTTVRPGDPEVLKRAWPAGVPFPPPADVNGQPQVTNS